MFMHKPHQLAHRMAWFLVNGEFDTSKFILHRCDNPACVNPNHLWEGTNADNMKDMAVKERSRATKLNAHKVLEIRERYSNKEKNQYELADEYGVTQGTIGEAIRKETWRHV